MKNKLTSAQFADRCIKHGIFRDRCGQGVRDALKELRCPSAGTNRNRRRAVVINLAVAAGLARWMPEKRLHVITPAGETWLTELEIHGLID